MRAKSIASDLRQYFDRSGVVYARVHSIFQDVINIMDQHGELITLISDRKEMTPMSLQVDFTKMPCRRLVSDDEVVLDAGALKIPRIGFVLRYEQSSVWNPELNLEGLLPINETFIRTAEQVHEVLMRFGDRASILPLIKIVDRRYAVPWQDKSLEFEGNTYTDFIEDILLEILDHLAKNRYDEVAGLIHRFIGFGPGLTPSTDDFLMGLEMTLYTYEQIALDGDQVKQFIKLVAEEAAGKTTAVSEAMLKNAARGRIALTHGIMLREIFKRDSNQVQTIANDVLKHGATSGTDFLFGLYCAQVLLIRNKR